MPVGSPHMPEEQSQGRTGRAQNEGGDPPFSLSFHGELHYLTQQEQGVNCSIRLVGSAADGGRQLSP